MRYKEFVTKNNIYNGYSKRAIVTLVVYNQKLVHWKNRKKKRRKAVIIPIPTKQLLQCSVTQNDNHHEQKQRTSLTLKMKTVQWLLWDTRKTIVTIVIQTEKWF